MTMYVNRRNGVIGEVVFKNEEITTLYMITGKDKGEQKVYANTTMKRGWKVYNEEEVDETMEDMIVTQAEYGAEIAAEAAEVFEYDFSYQEEKATHPEVVEEETTEEAAEKVPVEDAPVEDTELEKCYEKLAEMVLAANIEIEYEKNYQEIVAAAEIVLADYYNKETANYSKWQEKKKQWISETGKLKRFIKKYTN